MINDLPKPRKPTEVELQELINHILECRENDSEAKWDDCTKTVEEAMVEGLLFDSWIAVFDSFRFKKTSKPSESYAWGKLMSCVWGEWSSVCF